jgi:hypothetical protein
VNNGFDFVSRFVSFVKAFPRRVSAIKLRIQLLLDPHRLAYSKIECQDQKCMSRSKMYVKIKNVLTAMTIPEARIVHQSQVNVCAASFASLLFGSA